MGNKKKINKLLSGNSTSTQKEKLLNEIKNDAKLKEEYEKIKNIYALSSYNKKMDSLQVEKSYFSFYDQQQKERRKNSFVIPVLKYAAAIVLLFMLGFLSHNFIFNQNETSIALADYNEVYVPNGERSCLTLSDGSVVWLNSGTKFRFPRTFNKENRRVYLSGEAFFEVKKGKVPFIVSSDFGSIKVLGTHFNVRAYNDIDFRTTLVEGSMFFKNELGENCCLQDKSFCFQILKEL